MSADCVQDILAGFASYVCPLTGEVGVHRGTIADIHGDFTAAGLFSRPYSLSTVETSMGEIHDSVDVNGASLNYVGPGAHIIATPQMNTRLQPLMARRSDIVAIPDSDWKTTDGLSEGYYATHKRTRETIAVCDSSDPRHTAHVHVMHVVNGAERWLLGASGHGWRPIQRMRMLLGNREWTSWVLTLTMRQAKQVEMQVDAEMALGHRVEARALSQIAGDLRAEEGAKQRNLRRIEAQINGFRAEISWAA